MKIRDFILSLVSWFILLVTVSCSDELGGERTPISSESNLHVLVPTVLSSRGTNPDDASGLPTYNATVDECQINDLTLYAFPTGNEGKLLKKTLPAPLASMMLEQHVANYQLNIEPGTYHIYVVANMNKVLSGQTIKTEDELKNIVLNYVAGTEPGMPVSTNIPMIYEPKDVNGKIIDTKIEKSGKKYTTVAANLKFTCVKVKLNLLFDPTAEGSAFKGKSYRIKDILAQKLSPSTTLSWNGAFSNSNVSIDYAKGFENEVYATSSEASNKGGYYEAGDWTETADNANVNNKNIITLIQGATPTAAPQNAADKWLFQGTYYLPERYIANASQQSTLKVNGFVNDSFENNYTIKLGHRQDESPTSTEVPTFPRGTYYEIIGNIKSLGNMTLDCNVSVKDWTPVTIDAEFNHTTLWVSKTKASVTSTTTDSIDYESNVMLTAADFGCDEKVTTSSGVKDVIVLSKLDAVKNHRITFKINEDIKFSDYNGKHQGTAKVWIKAGNIKKYLDVTYDASPYFEVNPQEVTIYWGSDYNTKVVQFKTNLGGLAFTGNTSSTVGKSTIQASCDTPDTREGTFKIKATSDPVTTTVHYLTVQPKESAEGFNFVKKIKVTVKPAMGNYRINFRAINDRTHYKGGNGTDNYEGTLEEKKETNNVTGENTNWADGWYDLKDKDIPNPDHHYTYVYTQIGETTGTEVNSKVWKFTENWPGDKMVADYANVGWYYVDFKENEKSNEELNENGATGVKTIKPGETLIIFSNNTNKEQGYTLHRCTHHLEPGIPLFDYEDREGWIVYDPTSDPTWNIYDAMPTIENIKFTIYTKFQTYGWFKVYGVANGKNGDDNNKERESFTIYDTAGKSWSCADLNNGWYKTVITLKAVKGDHEKDIRIKIPDDKSILLFNGNSYENDTGYYDDSSWHAGKPSGVD
ncbi:fimbrial protein [Segatella copri]|uniref:fimbrial protein n=1 Tax=Segatella copri TaxID=165179 RepID=UPI0032C1C436